jgi:hypothetical protein
MCGSTRSDKPTGFSRVVTYRRLSSLRFSTQDRLRDRHYPERLTTQTGQSTVRHRAEAGGLMGPSGRTRRMK